MCPASLSIPGKPGVPGDPDGPYNPDVIQGKVIPTDRNMDVSHQFSESGAIFSQLSPLSGMPSFPYMVAESSCRKIIASEALENFYQCDCLYIRMSLMFKGWDVTYQVSEQVITYAVDVTYQGFLDGLCRNSKKQ